MTEKFNLPAGYSPHRGITYTGDGVYVAVLPQHITGAQVAPDRDGVRWCTLLTIKRDLVRVLFDTREAAIRMCDAMLIAMDDAAMRSAHNAVIRDALAGREDAGPEHVLAS